MCVHCKAAALNQTIRAAVSLRTLCLDGFIVHSIAYMIFYAERQRCKSYVSSHSTELQKPHNEGIIEYLSVSIMALWIWLCAYVCLPVFVCIDSYHSTPTTLSFESKILSRSLCILFSWKCALVCQCDWVWFPTSPTGRSAVVLPNDTVRNSMSWRSNHQPTPSHLYPALFITLKISTIFTT